MTTDLAPNFDASQQFSTSELAPHFDASPLLTTEMAARFDAPPPPSAPAASRPLRPPVREVIQESTQALAPEFMSPNPPAYPGSQAAPPPPVETRPLRPPVREVNQQSTQALAPEFMSANPPAYPAAPPEPARAAKPAPVFDMDKTVELQGGFNSDDDKTAPEEQLGELDIPLLAPLRRQPGGLPLRCCRPPRRPRPTPPAAFRPSQPQAAAAPARAIPPLASKPATQGVFKADAPGCTDSQSASTRIRAAPRRATRGFRQNCDSHRRLRSAAAGGRGAAFRR